MNSMIARAVTLAVGLAALSGCGYNNEVRVPFHQAIAVTGSTPFVLKNTAGTVLIKGWNQPRIDISGYKTGSSIETANAITIDVKRTAQAITVTTDYPSGMSRGGAVYRIHLPEATPLSVDNAAGTVTIGGTTSDVTGSVGAGTLDVTMARLTGTQRVTLTSGTGTVALHVPGSSDATIATHVSVGSVKTNLPSMLGKGTAQVDLTATVGSITIDRT